MKGLVGKKLISLTMAVLLVTSLCSCGKQREDKELVANVTTQPTVASAQPTITAAQPTVVPVQTAAGSTANLISNGDFTNGQGKWALFMQGGSASMKVNAKGQLEISIAKLGSVDYGVQAYLDEFALNQGCKYKISFDISSSIERDIEWRIQMNGGDYHAYVSEVLSLSDQPLHYEKEFDMSEASDPAPRMCFNMGVRPEIKDAGKHTVTIDNVELKLVDESKKAEAPKEIEKPDINLNQIGYQTGDVKTAVFRGENVDTTFEVINVETGNSVYVGKISAPQPNLNTGENDAVGDFSELKTPGTYKLVADQCGESYEFVIADDVYDKVYNDVIKMLYLQRCGTKLKKDLAGEFAHPICHSTKATIYGTSNEIDVSGGWHDAGDYGRYVVSGAKAVADLLLAYEENPSEFGDASGIPESGNKIPDILDEVRYELNWMLKMQESSSGGVYHKVTCANFPEVVMPQGETEELIVAPISNCATGDFSAVMALAARVYQDIDTKYAKQCLKASKKALNYLESHNNATGFKNPDDIVTGEYGDSNDADEHFWALAELYKTTGNKSYESKLKKFNILSVPGGLGWDSVGFYGMYSYLTCTKTDKALAAKMKDKFDYALNNIITNADSDGYSSTLGDQYTWGSNMGIANNGMLLIMANNLNRNKKYLDLAQKQLNYLLGANANSYCFVTGYGSLSPKATHHRPSQSLGKTMPGMLVGGPDANLEDPYARATLQKVPKAKCYVDNEQSYSCNEVTVYWNSPLIYLLTYLTTR